VDSKSTYIQAIEIEPLSCMTPETLRSQQADTEFTTDPFQGVTRW